MRIALRLSCIVLLLLAACGSGVGAPGLTGAAIDGGVPLPGEEPAFYVVGAVTAISIDPQTFTMGDTVIAVDAQTRFEGPPDAPASLAELQVGDTANADAVKRIDGSLLAKVVHVFRPPPAAAAAQGPIEAVDATTITVAGIQFSVTNATVIRRNAALVPFSDLKVDQSVVVKAKPGDGGRLVAQTIDVLLVPRPLPKLVSLSGPIDSVTSNTLTVLGQVLEADAKTLILRGNNIVPLSSLRQGERAQVTGKIIVGTGLFAVVIHVAN
ncbi:MAG TPA: DUF5666 domain-containing protein [Myxococcales bacterium]